jgi:putative transposon-encoded protein
MAKTIIEAEQEDVVSKKNVSSGSHGQYGVVYVPKAWIGHSVYVVLKRGPK